MKTRPTYRDALKLLGQLPEKDFEKLLSALKNDKCAATAKQFDKEFLLSAPVMSTVQFRQYQKLRKHFNQWRQN